MQSKETPQGKYLWTAKIGEKGQLVIPKEAREVFSIHPGDTVFLLGDIERGIALISGERCQTFLNTVYQIDEKPSGTDGERKDPSDASN